MFSPASTPPAARSRSARTEEEAPVCSRYGFAPASLSLLVDSRIFLVYPVWTPSSPGASTNRVSPITTA